jgi:hypothetical protein
MTKGMLVFALICEFFLNLVVLLLLRVTNMV